MSIVTQSVIIGCIYSPFIGVCRVGLLSVCVFIGVSISVLTKVQLISNSALIWLIPVQQFHLFKMFISTGCDLIVSSIQVIFPDICSLLLSLRCLAAHSQRSSISCILLSVWYQPSPRGPSVRTKGGAWGSSMCQRWPAPSGNKAVKR